MVSEFYFIKYVFTVFYYRFLLFYIQNLKENFLTKSNKYFKIIFTMLIEPQNIPPNCKNIPCNIWYKNPTFVSIYIVLIKNLFVKIISIMFCWEKQTFSHKQVGKAFNRVHCPFLVNSIQQDITTITRG